MTGEPLPGDAADAPAPGASAGVLLAQARQTAGLSVDDVAGQLKLAPRQVAAIERDDFASLPGRTFVRGFIRNYARLVKLDVDTVLAAIPDDGTAQTPERALSTATGRSIGEIPRDSRPRPGMARWMVPLVLAAIVAVAAFYEFARPPAPVGAPAAQVEPVAPAPPPSTPSSTVPSPADESAAPAGSAGAVIGSTPPATSELPNPLAGGTATATDAGNAARAATPAAAPAARGQLTLAFRGTSWLEVRDRTGTVVLSMTGAAGTTHDVAVSPPGELVLGNAAAVDATWRGKSVDLASYTKQNVARVRLE